MVTQIKLYSVSIFSGEDHRNLILFRWAEGRIPDDEIPRLLINLLTSAALAESEGLTIFSPRGPFADPSFDFLYMFLRAMVEKDVLPEPDEIARFAQKIYTKPGELPLEGTEVNDNFRYAVDIYLSHKANLKNLPPMIIFPDRSYFSTGF